MTRQRGLADRLEQLGARRGARLGELGLGGEGEHRRRVELLAGTLRAGGSIFRPAVDGVDAEHAEVALCRGEGAHVGGDAPQHEVDVLAAFGRNVVNRERDALGSLGQVGPLERRRGAFAVAGVADVQLARGGHARALQRQRRRRRRLLLGLGLRRLGRRRAAIATRLAALSARLAPRFAPRFAPRLSTASLAPAATFAPRTGRIVLDALGAIRSDELEVRLAARVHVVFNAVLLASELVGELPCALACAFEADDARASQCRERGTQRLRSRLRDDLILLELHLAAHAAVDVRVGLRRVVVVRARRAIEAAVRRHLALVAVPQVERILAAVGA